MKKSSCAPMFMKAYQKRGKHIKRVQLNNTVNSGDEVGFNFLVRCLFI